MWSVKISPNGQSDGSGANDETYKSQNGNTCRIQRLPLRHNITHTPSHTSNHHNHFLQQTNNHLAHASLCLRVCVCRRNNTIDIRVSLAPIRFSRNVAVTKHRRDGRRHRETKLSNKLHVDTWFGDVVPTLLRGFSGTRLRQVFCYLDKVWRSLRGRGPCHGGMVT